MTSNRFPWLRYRMRRRPHAKTRVGTGMARVRVFRIASQRRNQRNMQIPEAPFLFSLTSAHAYSFIHGENSTCSHARDSSAEPGIAFPSPSFEEHFAVGCGPSLRKLFAPMPHAVCRAHSLPGLQIGAGPLSPDIPAGPGRGRMMSPLAMPMGPEVGFSARV